MASSVGRAGVTNTSTVYRFIWFGRGDHGIYLKAHRMTINGRDNPKTR